MRACVRACVCVYFVLVFVVPHVFRSLRFEPPLDPFGFLCIIDFINAYNRSRLFDFAGEGGGNIPPRPASALKTSFLVFSSFRHHFHSFPFPFPFPFSFVVHYPFILTA